LAFAFFISVYAIVLNRRRLYREYSMYLKVNGTNLYYEQTGEGTPFLLLHGNGEDHRIFDELSRVLSHHYTIYAVDSRSHGKSSKSGEISYDLMAEDIAAFIHALELECPLLYGFSDGGIVGLLLASRYPDLLSKLIVSGANCSPQGLRAGWRALFRLEWFFTRSPLIRMMLDEPDIHPEQLASIQIPVLVLAGSRDVIKKKHTGMLAEHIPHSILKILPHETHDSYVVHQESLYQIIKPFLEEWPEAADLEELAE
jgi:pimeloyl-ACP methyl ester carboxylesterase